MACSWVPSYLPYYLCLFLPYDRAYVSISNGFPIGVGFLGNPALKGFPVWTPARCIDHQREPSGEFSRSDDVFCAPLGSCYPPDAGVG